MSDEAVTTKGFANWERVVLLVAGASLLTIALGGLPIILSTLGTTGYYAFGAASMACYLWAMIIVGKRWK